MSVGIMCVRNRVENWWACEMNVHNLNKKRVLYLRCHGCGVIQIVRNLFTNGEFASNNEFAI